MSAHPSIFPIALYGLTVFSTCSISSYTLAIVVTELDPSSAVKKSNVRSVLCKILYVDRKLAHMVVAPHARLAKRDFAAWRHIIPPLWPMILTIQDQALVSGIAAQIRLAEQRLHHRQTGLMIAAFGLIGRLSSCSTRVWGRTPGCPVGFGSWRSLRGAQRVSDHALRVTPILATVGTSQLFCGMSLVITGGPAIQGFPAGWKAIGNNTVFGVPIPMLVMIAVFLLVMLLLRRTSPGVSITLVGTNARAARFSGVRSRAIVFGAFALCGECRWRSHSARTNAAKADYGSSYLLVSVLVALLGGTNPRVGRQPSSASRRC
jgi:branched-subunit amino acid ABC-type transport system permease component